jgi:formate hydrogenlyase subunit 3/multisubunit Na+/H+ antiporter MnhD subunit
MLPDPSHGAARADLRDRSKTAITERVKTYYGWLLVLQAAMTGVFASRDLMLFYICFEFTLVPMYILISLYGSTNRRKAAATKFFLYTFTGSVIALAGLVYVVWFNATQTKGNVWTLRSSACGRSTSPPSQPPRARCPPSSRPGCSARCSWALR